ncbi:Hpt domain-containing protein [Thioalkalivibrio sp. ALJT]|uniref:hybrid sensor histidine kinase/response regulator n=1 Tax=Thioalkalivibrio sp. ALJT TaxID=1158146 RepID=UPI000368D05F|nr:Hpt domain-containing protein [Thioalkalivibrio sp. ALJT]
MASSALNWVRDELGKLFAEVQDALRRYSEDLACRDCLAEARSRVKQIRNTLVILEMENVVMVLDEMLQALEDLEQAEAPDPASAAPLLRAALQLPDYLENEVDGELPPPLSLVPLLNELRSSRGASLLLDVATLMPDPREVDDAQIGSGARVLEPTERLAALLRARKGFQRDLLGLVRGDDAPAHAASLLATVHSIEEMLPAGDARRLVWVAGAVLEAIAEGGVAADTDIRRLIGRIDRELGRYLNLLSGHVETAGDASEPEYVAPGDLIKTLLFHVACATSRGGQVRAVREVFGLDRLGLEVDGGSVSHSVYASLRQALEDDLAEVRERLDVIVRSPVRDPESLETLREQVERIGSTLNLVGLDAGQEHTAALVGLLVPEHAGTADNQVDMVLAEHLLALESLLESGLRRRSVDRAQEPELDRTLVAAVSREALVDVRRVRDTLLEYFDPAAEATADGLDEARAGLRRIEGAMAMSGVEALQTLLGPLRRHLDARAGMQASALDEGEVEALAEVLSSIEVALESFGQPWRELYSVHERGIAALRRIGAIPDAGDQEVGPTDAAPEPEPAFDATISALDVPEVPAVEQVSEADEASSGGAVSVPDRGRDSLPFDEQVLAEQVRGPDADPEIQEIFLEEADEEFARLDGHFPRWQSNPADLDALTVVRRSFHTLKGSGRLAGALRLGEFAWAVESFLNGLLDAGQEADHAALQVIEDAIAVLPGLVAEVRDGRGPETPVLDIALRLRALAGGAGEAELEPPLESDSESEEMAPEVPEGAVKEFEALARTLDALEAVENEPEPKPAEVDADLAVPVESESEPREEAEPADPVAVARMEVDPQLWELFAAEAQTHLQTVRDWLEESRRRSDWTPSRDLERALHTLNGSARTADIRGIYSVCGPFERLIRIHRDMGWALPSPATELLRRLEVYVASAVEDAEPSPAKLLDPPAWASELYALLDQATAEQLAYAAENAATSDAAEPDREKPPEPVGLAAAAEPEAAAVGTIDLEFAEVFVEEARDILEAAFPALHGWREARGQPGPDQSAFQRELHTLKGSARMAGFTVVGAIAHALESALNVETETGLEPREGFFQLAERALTDVQGLVERGIGVWQMDEASSESLPALRQWAAGETRGPPLAAGTEETGSDAESGPDTAAPMEDLRSQEPPEAHGRRIQDQVRMDADVLDRMVNNAGELASFYRRFEQTVGRVDGQVDELERTIARLRDQLRKLEIETEAQILFRVEEESGEGALDFDPLEMDRYSGIQQLSRALAESVSDLEALKQEVYDELQTAGGILLQQRRVGTDLQDQLMRQRMVRFARTAPRLRRVARQVGEDLGKPVAVEFNGLSAEIDRALLERVVAPLEHLLRNAIAHGIESREERERAGKPVHGRIDVSLEQSGGEVRLQVRDDGRGIDAESIRARALERALIAADAELSDVQILQLILQPGFSTALEVSQIAGRGVGLDVVNSDVKQLGGSLDIQSTPGRGSRFTMRLPFTLAISQTLLVQVGEETFAIPMAAVEGVVRVRAEELESRADTVYYNYIGEDYQIRCLGDLVGVESQAGVDQFPEQPFPLLLVRADDQRVALRIDALLGSQEVVVKSVGPVLSRIPGVAGATLRGDGSVMLMLDLGVLVRSAAATRPEAAQPTPEPASTRRIMVVDDSITIRKVTARLLARHGYDVVTARDGLDAMGLLDERRPQLILLDVEMPRMDGFEFAGHVRDHPDFAEVPIIMITSRSGAKHRERAYRLGVNAYLGKPYLENDLLAAIHEQLQEVPA